MQVRPSDHPSVETTPDHLLRDGRSELSVAGDVHSARVQLSRDGECRPDIPRLGSLDVDSQGPRLPGYLARLDHAVALAPPCGEWAAHDEQYDLTSGSAGLVAGLLPPHDARPSNAVLDAVCACADRILAGAMPCESGVGWLPRLMREGGVADRPLVGLAHGAAGVAWPLLAAAARCARPRYREAALAGIAYERAQVGPAEDTWRDLRHAAGGAPFDLSAWCHGAAGVGLARVRSLPYLTADDPVRAEIAAATGNDDVHVVDIDLAELASVRAGADVVLHHRASSAAAAALVAELGLRR